jgi:hypothetical protein
MYPGAQVRPTAMENMKLKKKYFYNIVTMSPQVILFRILEVTGDKISGRRPAALTVFLDFPPTVAGIVPQIKPQMLSSASFPFIILYSIIGRFIVRATDSVVK